VNPPSPISDGQAMVCDCGPNATCLRWRGWTPRPRTVPSLTALAWAVRA